MKKFNKIGDFLTRVKDKISIEDGNSYKRVTIKTKHQRIVLRDVTVGAEIGTKNQFFIREGQFLLSKIDARYGAFGIVPEELDNAIITGNFWTYDVDHEKIDIEWFFYYTHSPDFIKICEDSSTGTTHRKYLKENIFLNHEIVLRSIDEQKHMVEFYKLCSIHSNQIDSILKLQSKALVNLKKAILQEAIQGKLTADWREQNPYVEPASELLKRIKAEKARLVKEKKIRKEKPLPPITEDEIPFELPKGWVWCRLGDITTYGTSEKVSSDEILEDTWVLDLEDIEKYSSKILQRITFAERPSTSTKSRFEAGWVLYSKLRPYLDKVVVPDEAGVCTTEILPLPVFCNMNPYFMMYTMKTRNFLSYVNSRVSGMKMPRLRTDDGKMALIPIAPLAEQSVVVDILGSIFSLCESLKSEIDKSCELNDQLMQAVLKEAFESKPVKA